MLDLESHEHLLDSMHDLLLDLTELHLSLILLVEFLLKVKEPHISESDSLFIVHDSEVGFILCKGALMHVKLVVAEPGVVLVIDVDLQGEH